MPLNLSGDHKYIVPEKAEAGRLLNQKTGVLFAYLVFWLLSPGASG